MFHLTPIASAVSLVLTNSKVGPISEALAEYLSAATLSGSQ